DLAGEPLDDGRLTDAWLAEEHDRIRSLAVAQDLGHLLNFRFASEHRRYAVLTREQIQVRAELCQRWRKLQTLLHSLPLRFTVACKQFEPAHDRSHVGLGLAEHRARHVLVVLEQAHEDVRRRYHGPT